MNNSELKQKFINSKAEIINELNSIKDEDDKISYIDKKIKNYNEKKNLFGLIIIESILEILLLDKSNSSVINKTIHEYWENIVEILIEKDNIETTNNTLSLLSKVQPNIKGKYSKEYKDNGPNGKIDNFKMTEIKNYNFNKII